MTAGCSPAPRPTPPVAIAAVLLFSADPDRLARFYIEHLAIPLRHMNVPGHPVHWACDIGRVYFSIWPISAEDATQANSHAPRGGAAFYVPDVQREFQRLEGLGVPVEFPPQQSVLGIIARLRDPDGNIFELYQPRPR